VRLHDRPIYRAKYLVNGSASIGGGAIASGKKELDGHLLPTSATRSATGPPRHGPITWWCHHPP